MKKYLVLLLLSSFLFVLKAQSEFLVNTHLPDDQRDPQVGKDLSGNFVVVWESENQLDSLSKGDIFLQAFDNTQNPVGSETLVNQFTSNDQIKPALAMNSNGNFVVTWASYTSFDSIYDVKARLYKQGSAFTTEFLVNSTTDYSQTNPEIAINDSGNFIIVWESWYQDGSNKGIYAQRFDSLGNKIGVEFLVNTTTTYSQARPVVKYFPDGRFLVIWESWLQDIVTPSGYGLYGQIFSANALPLGTEFQINTYTNDYQWLGDIEIIDNNEFIAVWCSWEQDGHFGGIYFQRFDGNGQKIGAETLVNQQTSQYQWLPKVKKLNNNDIAIVWSSWKQDGSREGIYCRYFKPDGSALTLESRINDYTESFQWEPDFFTGTGNEITVFWSSWGQYGNENDYEIIGKFFTPIVPAGGIDPTTYQHSGRSSSRIKVHVMDSTVVTGDQYEVSFQVYPNDSLVSTIENITTSTIVVDSFIIDKGKGVFYLTPIFEGVAVEYFPEFKLSLDVQSSYFLNTSGTNLQFSTGLPVAGTPRLAPIDIMLIWGNTDTLSNGLYAQPSDTAIGINGVRDIVVPFYAWSITDSEKVELLIMDQDVSENKRWDPGERIIFLTPARYRQSPTDTHAQLDMTLPGGQITMPGPGDLNYIFTIKPITNDDKYYFETDLQYLTGLKIENKIIPKSFSLAQNYPNPFNAFTTIKYHIEEKGKVNLTLYNILGQKVKVLVNSTKEKGNYKTLLDAQNLASGLYFYSLVYNNKSITKKMILMK